MSNPDIGVIPCPVCQFDCFVRESKKFKAYFTCDECGLQAFSRGVVSDHKIRAKMRPVDSVSAEPAAVDKVTVHTSDGKRHEAKIKTPATETESTIFDVIGRALKS